MSKEFSHLRHWLTGEDYLKDCPPRPVILECIPSRSGMSTTVYDRGERIFAVNGCGFDQIGTALATFLESQFQPELCKFAVQQFRDKKADFPNHSDWVTLKNFPGFGYHAYGAELVHLDGATGFSSMQQVAEAIGLSVQLSETKGGTLIIIQKKGE